MICTNCGNPIQPGEGFCSRCGVLVTEPTQGYDTGVNITENPIVFNPGTHNPETPISYSGGAIVPEDPAGFGADQNVPLQQADYQPPQTPVTQPDSYGGTQPTEIPADHLQETQQEQHAAGYRPAHKGGGIISDVVESIKSVPLKKLLPIAIAAVAILIALIVAISLVGSSGNSTVKDDISLFEGTNKLIFSGNNNAMFTISGTLDSIQRSSDGSKAVLLTTGQGNSGGKLWSITTSGSELIAEDVYGFLLSDSGNGVVYTTAFDAVNDMAMLYLHDMSSGRKTLISKEAAVFASMGGISISPNGKSVGYVSDYDPRNSVYTGYVRIDGKDAASLGDNTFAIAISDGGKYIYYLSRQPNDYYGSLLVKSGKIDTKLVSEYSSYIPLMLNKDYSQIIFETNERSYISRNGNDREKISGSYITDFILPRGSYIRECSTYVRTMVYNIKSFTNQVAVTGENLVYINKNLEINEINNSSESASAAFISDNGKTLLYINNSGHLSAIDPTNLSAERREVARDVTGFAPTNNIKTIYYINDDNELWCKKGNSSPVKISDDVIPEHLVLPYNSTKAFFLVDYSEKRGGELYFSNNGGKRAKVSGGNDIMAIWSTPASIFYISYDDEIFRSKGSERFTFFTEYQGETE